MSLKMESYCSPVLVEVRQNNARSCSSACWSNLVGNVEATIVTVDTVITVVKGQKQNSGRHTRIVKVHVYFLISIIKRLELEMDQFQKSLQKASYNPKQRIWLRKITYFEKATAWCHIAYGRSYAKSKVVSNLTILFTNVLVKKYNKF